MSQILDISRYEKQYDLTRGIIGIAKVDKPLLDIEQPGLIMHGSEADPYTILKYGLAPRQTDKNNMETEWQICLGLNSKSKTMTFKNGLARKNSAVKYAGNFSDKGIVYVMSDEVRKIPGYREFWDTGDEPRGYAWVSQAIVSDMIIAMITGNIALAAASTLATKTYLPIYKPDGTCYRIVPIT